jgi:hypothetical protein
MRVPSFERLQLLLSQTQIIGNHIRRVGTPDCESAGGVFAREYVVIGAWTVHVASKRNIEYVAWKDQRLG